jgi:hypothetical protein
VTAIENYLTELDELLIDVDPAIRDGLVSGIREELAGMNDADAAERLRVLGDPAFVAASARAELPRSTTALRRVDPAWYSVTTILLLTVGGYVVPGIGWLVGIVMLWASRTWTVPQKVVGTLLPMGAIAVPAALLLPAYVVSETVVDGRIVESTGGPMPWQVWLIVLLLGVAVIAWFAGWIWLLVAAERARRR